MKQAASNVCEEQAQSLMSTGLKAVPNQRCSNSKTKAGLALALVVAAALCSVIAHEQRGSLNRMVLRPVVKVEEKQYSYLAYSWRANAAQPFLVEPARVIFNLTPGEVAKRTFSKANAEIITSESCGEFATEVAAHLGVKGSYLAFEGAAESSLSSIARSQYKQFRLDKMITADILHVSHVNFDLWPKLSPQSKSYLLEKTVQQIHTTFGDFYATQASLGGIFQQTVIMQMRESDNRFDLESSIQASFSNLASSAAASLSGSASVVAKVKNRDAKVMLKVLGGEAEIWLHLSGDNQQETQKKWANSVTTENMFPLSMRLVPLWSLLEHKDANPTKAEELKRYMKDQWAKSKAKLPEYHYAPENQSPVAVPEKFKFVARTVDSGKGKSIQPSTYRDGWSAESGWVKNCGDYANLVGKNWLIVVTSDGSRLCYKPRTSGTSYCDMMQSYNRFQVSVTCAEGSFKDASGRKDHLGGGYGTVPGTDVKMLSWGVQPWAGNGGRHLAGCCPWNTAFSVDLYAEK